MPNVPTPQGKFWLLTVPHRHFTPYLPNSCCWTKGQLESGAQEGYLHWQFVVCFTKKVRLAGVKLVFGDELHAELSNSPAANDYVWKDETAVANTRFELGILPRKRGCPEDWNRIRDDARSDRLELVPADIYIRYYGNLKRIAVDSCQPVAIERTVVVLWGPTGVGKSRRAWEEAGLDAYPKDPRSKFWDGYRGQSNVVIDEFRGDIDISHVLRWFDRYPVIVEVKGSSVVLKAQKIWITSNLCPDQWYPNLDVGTRAALMRRLEVIECENQLY